MTELVELGTVSSRGQICIPTDIREQMGLTEGSKVLFFLTTDESLLVKKVHTQTWAEITKPLKEAAKKSGLTMSDVDSAIQKVRREKR